MKSRFERTSRALTLLALAPALVCLCSCRSACLGPFTLSNPLARVDHVQLTHVKAATTVIDTRVTPATVVAGKKALTLEDCRGMALARNPEIQIGNMEELSRAAAARSFAKHVLPHFVLSTEMGQTQAPRWYHGEPNPWHGTAGWSAASAEWLADKNLRRYTAELSWSPNDASQAYLLMDNTRDEALMAHYDKIRRAQELVGCVDSAYFRLLGLQESASTAHKLASLRADLLQRMKELYQKRLIGLEQLNDAQQKMVRARLTLARVKTETERQRNVLASKMGISPNYTVDGGFRLVGALSRPQVPPELNHVALWDMERSGLKNRPESYKAVLQYLKCANDVKRTVIKYFPHVVGFYRYSRVEDRNRYDKDWKEIGVNARADLLDIWANIDEVVAAKLKRDSTDRAFDAVASQVVSQVRDAALRFQEADEIVRTSLESLENSKDFLQMALKRETAGDLNKISVEEARANVLERTVEVNRALSEANACLAELHAAMAVNYNEPLPYL